MSDSSKERDDLLSAFDLGPAWAREGAKEKKYDDHRGEDAGGRGRRDDRRGGGGDRRGGGGGGGGDRRGGGGDRRGGGKRFDGPKGARGAKGRGPERDLPDPTPGVKVRLLPSEAAIHLISKEIQHRARVYSLFDVAKLFLSARERYVLEIDVEPKRPPLFRSVHDDSLFVTKEEAVAHFVGSEAFAEYYETEEIEGDPPKGNFQVVARCGLSGEWLGPPNFHAYQSNLRRLHRERFAHMPFERYAAKVRTERGEEAVSEWLESMKKRTRWRRKGGGDDDWTFDRAEIERDFLLNGFSAAFREVHRTELPGDVPANHVSEGVMAAVRIVGSHARHHPAMMIPSICKLLTSDHLSIFKRKGKLFCGPARPHPLADTESLAERPSKIVAWLSEHPNAKLNDLWSAMLPEAATEPPREWLADLFWLLMQGHVLLFSNDTLVLPVRGAAEVKEGKKTRDDRPEDAGNAPPKSKKRRRRRGKKPRVRPAKFPSRGGESRRIQRMQPGALRKLRGRQRIVSRRLERRDKIESLLEE